MNVTWQDTAAIGILMVALGYLASRVARRFRRRELPGCGRCPQCSPQPPEILGNRRPDCYDDDDGSRHGDPR